MMERILSVICAYAVILTCIGCGTFLVVNDHPFFAIFVLLMAGGVTIHSFEN